MNDQVKIVRPIQSMPFDGERLTTVMPRSQIEMEHFQRYFFALDICKDKVVLDIASGEGYGSSILAKSARHVFGVDSSARAVEHARSSYLEGNISFSVGRAENIPFCDSKFDIVVSFETLEHLTDHDGFIREVKRVLKPDGVLMISTPDEHVYSAEGSTHNPFHLRELNRTDFEFLLKKYFGNTSLYFQKSIIGTIMLGASQDDTMILYERIGEDLFSIRKNYLNAPYMVCIASDAEFSFPKNCIMCDTSEFGNIVVEHKFLAARVDELSVYVQSLERIAHEREEAIFRLEALLAKG